MKKIVFAAAIIAVLPWAAAAQVEKQVEVTKAYVPSVESAAKLAAMPDMTDTVKMRPEIDYAITPLSLRTTLTTRPIRPATVTYWEFNRPQPFYLKVGAGYPTNSVLDFYASTQNPGTGYALGYVNHEGRYARIKNDFGIKNNSMRMFNRIGAAAGKYFGPRTLEGEISYENRLYHRYGGYSAADAVSDDAPGVRVNYGDARAAFRFGDDFQDFSRINFELTLSGGLFFDHSVAAEYGNKARQTTFETSAKLARGFGRHRLSAEVGYERLAGQKSIDNYKEHIIRGGLRYGVNGDVVRFEAGADYYHDKIGAGKAGNYIVPFLRLDFNLGTPGLKPFVELDGGVSDNSFRSLTRLNPYLAAPSLLDRDPSEVRDPQQPVTQSTVNYNGRFGIGGNLFREKLSYRLYAGFSIRDNQIYWTNLQTGVLEADQTTLTDVYCLGAFNPTQARQTVTSLNAEIECRPLSQLHLTLGVHGYLYNDDTRLGNGSPSFAGNLGARYVGRKISFGVSAQLQSERSWTVRYLQDTGNEGLAMKYPAFVAPTAVDLRIDFEWRVSRRVSIFAEGRNLANARLYEFAWYPEYGANFTAGIKANF